MEGLIPYLLHAIQKQRHQNTYRCLSNASESNRSCYHLLAAGSDSFHNSFDGSSQGRTHSKFPTASEVESCEQRTNFESQVHSHGVNGAALFSSTTGSNFFARSYDRTENPNNLSSLRY